MAITRHRDVGRGRPRKRHEPQNIGDEDEEEGRQQVGQKRAPLSVRNVGLRDFVADENDQDLHHILKDALGGLGSVVLLFVALCQGNEDPQHDEHRQQPEDEMPRNGEVRDDLPTGADRRAVEVLLRLNGFCELRRRRNRTGMPFPFVPVGGQAIRSVLQEPFRASVRFEGQCAVRRADEHDARKLNLRKRLEVEVVAVLGVPEDGVVDDALKGQLSVRGLRRRRGQCQTHSQHEEGNNSQRANPTDHKVCIYEIAIMCATD